MDEQEEVQQNNMISNLPLLFANGYPTSLDKISETQLENFIPFMVQCSLGHINLQGRVDCSEPEWWPEDLPYTIPLSKPKKFSGNWIEKMKEVVIICYQFHKSVFLLRFCNDLASYEHASLRFINNYNSTTSLFDRRNNKLLVTFRNENMSYDQTQRNRKCLLQQQKSKNGRQSGQELQQMMVEPPPFDIYLCDNCDAELYSREAILEHERTCNIDDDDVILCDTPEPIDETDNLVSQSNTENNELQIGFLRNFNLQFRDCDKETKKSGKNEPSTVPSSTTEEGGFMIMDRNKRLPRRNRALHSLTRCPTIPLSSPAGQLLLRTTKTAIPTEYLDERLERLERFCQTPLLSKFANKSRYSEKKSSSNTPHCTFKKPQDYSSHKYVFPRRQFSQRRRKENFLFLNSSLIRRCRPISVRLKKISESEIRARPRTAANNSNNNKNGNNKINIKLTRDSTRSSGWKISSASTEVIVDTIDLCSSDDDDDCTSASVHSSVPVAHPTNERAVPKTKVSTSTAKGNISRVRLKNTGNRIQSSEVSLIPINKSTPKSATSKRVDMTSSLMKIVASAGEVSSTDKRNVSSNYEGNILVSPSDAVPSENGIALPKPLQPSLYIYSNYTTKPLTAIVASSNETSPTANCNLRSHNQENQLRTATGASNANKSISSTSGLSASINANTSSSTSHNSSSNTNQTNLMEQERGSRSLSLKNSFTPPGCVISIDLTT